MVAYRKISKDVRNGIKREMSRNYRKNHPIKKKIHELGMMIGAHLSNNVPSDFLQIAIKYPDSIMSIKEAEVSLQRFYTEDNVLGKRLYNYIWPYIIIPNYIVGFNSEIDCNIYINRFALDTKEFANYVKNNIPDAYKLAEEIVQTTISIFKWENDLDCVLRKITTLNKLKSEFPEAYDTYVNVYGDPENKKKVGNYDDCKTPINKAGETLCDVVEKIRADYNNKKINKEDK